MTMFPEQPNLRTLHFDMLLFPTSLEAIVAGDEEKIGKKQEQTNGEITLSSSHSATSSDYAVVDNTRPRTSNVTVVKQNKQVIFEM